VEDGFGLAGTRFTYALGGLSLWSADPGLAGRLGPGLLSDASLRHIAVANPDLAPYGAAAMDVLGALDLQGVVKDRLVFGENVAQAHAVVASRAATVGFTARSLVLTAGIDEDQRWDIPSDLHKPIAQDAVLTRAGSQNQTARSFLSFLRGEEAARIITRYGYARP
jgi:molybdate transport system substrate-binding protein